MQVFEAPNTIQVPDPFDSDIIYDVAEKKYIVDLKQYLIDNGYTQEHTGEVLRFPYADGYALYMIASLMPLKLVHLPLMDEYQFPYIERLKKADVLARLARQKSW